MPSWNMGKLSKKTTLILFQKRQEQSIDTEQAVSRSLGQNFEFWWGTQVSDGAKVKANQLLWDRRQNSDVDDSQNA